MNTIPIDARSKPSFAQSDDIVNAGHDVLDSGGHEPPSSPLAGLTPHAHGARKVRRILVVDDKESIRESLAKVLRAEGYEVVLAASGFEAMNRYAPQETDVVILDLGLPGIDGWTAFQGIMALNPRQAVIFISGQVSAPTWGADAYPGVFLPKPLDVPLLLRCLKEMFDEPSRKRCERTGVQTAFVRVTKPLYGSLPEYGSQRHGGLNE